MRRMTAEELRDLEGDGAVVVEKNPPPRAEAKPAPPPVPQVAPRPPALPPPPDPVSSMVAMFKGVTAALEATEGRQNADARIADLESQVAALGDALTSERHAAPSLGELENLVRSVVISELPASAPPSPKVELPSKIDVVRRGRLIERVVVGDKTVYFRRGQDLSVTHLEIR